MKMECNKKTVVLCCLIVSFATGCAEFVEGLAEGGRSLREYEPEVDRNYNDPNAPVVVHVHVHNDDPYDWTSGIRERTREMERFNRQQELETRAIIENTRRMLRRSERLRRGNR